MRITKDMKMADTIHINHLLLSVLYRFNIGLGFGDKTVEQVCSENNIQSDFFLEILNAFIDKDYFPKSELQNFSVQLIIDYLSKSHAFYHNEKIPEIEQIIESMLDACQSQKENILLLKKFFLEYKQELINHTEREENLVFPYCRMIEGIYSGKNSIDEYFGKDQKYSIDIFEEEHDNIEEKLYDLKNIIIKYLPPTNDQKLCNKLLHNIFSLEQDINDHSRIEDQVLVPKIREMERIIQERKLKE